MTAAMDGDVPGAVAGEAVTGCAPADVCVEAEPESWDSDIVLSRLMRLHPKLIDLTLDRVERLLHAVGDPHRSLPPVIHVAGTNGKGSVVAYLRAMFEAAGRGVHVYTSPHLVRFHERIRLGRAGSGPGKLIDEAALLALLEECEAANGAAPITYFEITTVAALLAFARTPADALLLEVGLGGRLDATNVVEQPALSVITPVSPDHQQFLGDSLDRIAFEKAGILKPGVPAVIGPQEASAVDVISDRAAAVGAPLLLYGQDWWVECREEALLVSDRDGSDSLPMPVLPGAHQVVNAGLAVACARYLQRQDPGRFGLDTAAQGAGLTGATWPGRLQRLTDGPLLAALPPGWELWLDGGHNSAAGLALAEQARRWSDRPLHLITGMLNTKDTAGFFDPLLPFAGSVHTVAIPGEKNSRTAEEAAAIARERGAVAFPAASVMDALRRVASGGGAPARVMICGSLYLAGRVLAANNGDRPAGA